MTRPAATAGAGAPARRLDLVGLGRAELAEAVLRLGEPERAGRMRARQLWHWLYHQGAEDFAAMTTLPRGLRERLEQSCEIGRPRVVSEQVSSDGTQKWLLRFGDGQEVESVFIPEPDRGA